MNKKLIVFPDNYIIVVTTFDAIEFVVNSIHAQSVAITTKVFESLCLYIYIYIQNLYDIAKRRMRQIGRRAHTMRYDTGP